MNSFVIIKSSPVWALKTQIFLAEVVPSGRGEDLDLNIPR